jgi:photosystem II stability/assembly factor-like uncharacterized protein
MAVDPTASGTVYVGTASGLFKIVDGGNGWIRLPNGPAGLMRVLAIDPVSPSTIYAGGLGIFKSIDGGANWTAIGGSVTGETFALAIDPRSHSIVYAGGSEGFYKSVNGGVSWDLLRKEMYEGVETLAVDPMTPSRVHAATLYLGPAPPELPPYNSVLRSTDAGATWASPATDPPLQITSLAIDPVVPTTVYATSFFKGVYRSLDAGATWGVLSSGLPRPNALTVAIGAGSPSNVYIGTLWQSVFSISPQRQAPGTRTLPFRH